MQNNSTTGLQMDKKTKEQIDEYHLMIEEVLGGMDIMVSNIEKRVSTLEDRIDIALKDSSEIHSLRKDMTKMKSELTSGFELVFRKMNENK